MCMSEITMILIAMIFCNFGRISDNIKSNDSRVNTTTGMINS